MVAPFEAKVEARVVEIDYTNHRGERRTRRIIPCQQTLRFVETPHHTPAQWVFDAWDVERNLQRTFAFKSVHSWTVVT